MATCFHHTSVETGRKCSRCGRSACPDCLRQASVGSHCFECVKAAAPSKREQIRVRRAMGSTQPYVIYGLIAVNVAIFLYSVLVDRNGRPDFRPSGSFLSDWGLHAIPVDAGELVRLGSSGFLHFDLRHLLMNMLGFVLLGTFVERRIGPWRTAGVALVALFAASAGALWLSPLSLTAGASGVVYGMMGAAYLAERLRGGDPWNDGLGSLIIVQVVISFLIPNISIGGHLGGLVGGAVAVWAMGVGATGSPQAQQLRAFGAALAIAGAGFGLAIAGAAAGSPF